jgi:hypothetical protein
MSMPSGPYRQPWPQAAYPGPVTPPRRQWGASRWIIPCVTGAGGLAAGLVIGLGRRPRGDDGDLRRGSSGVPVAWIRGARPAGVPGRVVLEHAIRSMLAQRLANPAGQYYDPGVTVKSVNCVEQSKTSATCLCRLSSGQSGTDGMAILADGGSFVSK